LTIVPSLVRAGATVRVVDPQGKREGEELLSGAVWEPDVYVAAEQADALLILTEWNEFRGLDLARLCSVMSSPRMADLRNLYEREDVLASGFESYVAVGR